LLAVPMYSVLTGEAETGALITGGLGIADLAGLFLFRPADRIQALMGDMSQITMTLNSFQTQVGLRLLEMRADDPATVGTAADDIRRASEASVRLVEEYFEAKAEEAKKVS